MKFYIQPEELQQLLVAEKIFTLDRVPSLGAISDRILECQYLIEQWLGYDPLPKTYIQEERLNNHFKRFTLKSNCLPIIGVDKILVQKHWGEYDEYYELSEKDKNIVWDGNRVLDFLSIHTFWGSFTGYHHAKSQKVLIHYTAGYKEIPIHFKLAFKAVFLNSFKESLSWLGEPVADVQSIGISGVSKSIRLGKGAEGDPGTNLDRILATYLKRHVQHYIY